MAKRKGFNAFWAWLLLIVSILVAIEVFGLGLFIAGLGGFSIFAWMGAFGGWILIVFGALAAVAGLMNLLGGRK